MKALLLYSHSSGHKKVTEYLEIVRERLSDVFEVLDTVCTISKEEAFEMEKKAGENYDVLLISGGDGTFNNAVNAIMSSSKKPILGYLNFGTIGDVGKTFGISENLNRDLEIIKKGIVKSFDVGRLFNEKESMYFAYSATYGAYSDIAYAVPRHKKRRFGRMAYYSKAFRDAFKGQEHALQYEGNSSYRGESPFVMILLGTHIGGFRINKKALPDDGKAEVFLTRKGPFNGLMHYLHPVPKPHESASGGQFTFEEDLPWCLDGEKGPTGSVRFEIVPKALKIFVNDAN